MKVRRVFALTLFATALTAVFASAALAQSSDGNLANVYGGGSSVKFEVVAQNAGVSLTITAPDGRSFTKEYRAGSSPGFELGEKGLPDGTYSYELRLRPALTAGQREAMKASRGRDDDPEAERAARKPSGIPSLIQSGAFTVLNGQVIVGGVEGREQAKAPAANTDTKTAAPVKSTGLVTNAVTSGNTASRLRNHRVALMANYMFDVVFADDVIVQGSLCAGLDCVNNENFGFDTIRLKENNTRIQFDDTSAAGFPTNNWQIRANSSAGGGQSFLAFVDQGASGNSETGTIIFEVDAGAPANSLRVSSGGNVGIGTATPVLDVHVNTTDTPALRMEQNNSGGFTAQTWDIGANEANWFVRDVTGGSRLPLRIRPGAPTSSVDISATGAVGVGTASPSGRLDVRDSVAGVTSLVTDTDGTIITRLRGIGAATSQRGALELFNDGTITSAIFSDANDSFINGGGRLGVGTNAPTDTLSVNGTASKPGGGTWAVFSDERLKNIKGNYTPGLSAVMRLQPLRYQYKSDNPLHLESNKEYVGFGAQALQQVLPEAVSTNANGYLQVNSDPILWTMLNAIKEQQKEIEQLKSEVRRLRKTSHNRRR